MRFASGKKALAICDRCGMQYPYLSIKEEWNGSRVCRECYETKHPQLDPPDTSPDAEALRDAAPDRDEPAVDSTAYDNFFNGLP